LAATELTRWIKKFKDRARREELYCTPAYWDSKAEERDGFAVSLWENNCLNELYHAEQLRQLERALPNVAGLEVLDIGCGVGRISRWLAERGAKVIGADFSDKTIEIARRHSLNGNPRYRVQSAFELGDRDAFDLVISTGLLVVACTGRGQLMNVLGRLRDALKPQGRLVLMEPIHHGFLHRVLDLSVEDFCECLNEADFVIERVEQMHFWPARWLLAFFPWPESVTKIGYQLGQSLMRLPFTREMGDYKWVLASRTLRK